MTAVVGIFAFLIATSGSCRAHRKDTKGGIVSSVVHAEVALTSALSFQLELTKVTTNQRVYRYCMHINSLNQSTAVLSKVSIEGRQINRGEYTCSSSSNGNVAGSSLGGVAVLADMF